MYTEHEEGLDFDLEEIAVAKRSRDPFARWSLSTLKERLKQAQASREFGPALDLAAAVYSRESTVENQRVIKQIFLEMIGELRRMGEFATIAESLEMARTFAPKEASWLLALSAEAARCALIEQASSLLHEAKGIDPQVDDQVVLGHIVDQVIGRSVGSGMPLPSTLLDEITVIERAFDRVEKGDEEQARELLQRIGLRSPCLEWKVLLRGMMAYYEGEDLRAVENWRRLNPERVPVRIAAPFRAEIDEDFRERQTPEARHQLMTQYRVLQGDELLRRLDAIGKAMSSRRSMAEAFRLVERVLPELKKRAPKMVPRLSRYLYWSILRFGPDELPRYRRVFGAPLEDRHFHRLQAIGLQGEGGSEEAQHHWIAYEKEIEESGELWTEEDRNMARALIWLRMAKNAAVVQKDPLFGDLGFGRPIKPNAEKCYQRAIALVPDLLQAHEELFEYYIGQRKPKKAIEVGEVLIARFPDQVKAIQSLAKLYENEGNPGRSRELLVQAVQHHPLDRSLRAQLDQVSLSYAHWAMSKKQYAEGRIAYQQVLPRLSGSQRAYTLCNWAVGELLAGDHEAATALIEQARALNYPEAAIHYTMLSRARNGKMPASIIDPLQTQFERELSNPTPESVCCLLQVAYALMREGVNYSGMTAERRKIIHSLEKYEIHKFTEDQIVEVLRCLYLLNPPLKLFKTMIIPLQNRHPNHPWILYHSTKLILKRYSGMGIPASASLQRVLELSVSLDRSDPAVVEMLKDVERSLETLKQSAEIYERVFGVDGDSD